MPRRKQCRNCGWRGVITGILPSGKSVDKCWACLLQDGPWRNMQDQGVCVFTYAEREKRIEEVATTAKKAVAEEPEDPDDK